MSVKDNFHGFRDLKRAAYILVENTRPRATGRIMCAKRFVPII